MNWTCPKCGKSYGKENQGHICASYPIEEILREDENLIQLYEQFTRAMQARLGKHIVQTSKKAVTICTGKAFGVLRPRKDSLELQIFLPREYPDLPVYKIKPYTKTKFVHFVRIYDEEDLDKYLLSLLEEAREFSLQ